MAERPPRAHAARLPLERAPVPERRAETAGARDTGRPAAVCRDARGARAGDAVPGLIGAQKPAGVWRTNRAPAPGCRARAAVAGAADAAGGTDPVGSGGAADDPAGAGSAEPSAAAAAVCERGAGERGEPTGEAGQISIWAKGSKERAIRLPGKVWEELLARRAEAGPDEPVFVSRTQGKALTPHGIWRVVGEAARRVGLRASPHWLRHAHASHALDRSAPLHLVQATLGHATIATTGRYLHARPQDSSSRFLPL